MGSLRFVTAAPCLRLRPLEVEELDEFLTAERTLRSDVIDRLAHVLGCQLSQTR